MIFAKQDKPQHEPIQILHLPSPSNAYSHVNLMIVVELYRMEIHRFASKKQVLTTLFRQQHSNQFPNFSPNR
jgi:hypothetical protein